MLPQPEFCLLSERYKILIKNPVGASDFSQWGTSDWFPWMVASFRALVLTPNWMELLAESQIQPSLTSHQIDEELWRSESVLMLQGHLVIPGRALLLLCQLWLHQGFPLCLCASVCLCRAVGASWCLNLLFGIGFSFLTGSSLLPLPLERLVQSKVLPALLEQVSLSRRSLWFSSFSAWGLVDLKH